MTLEDKYWIAGFIDGINSSPIYGKRRGRREGAWSWEFSPPHNNDLFIFLKDSLGAKVLTPNLSRSKKETIRMRFTKTALVGIIEKIGPYLRNRRKVFQDIAKDGKYIPHSSLKKSIEFPPQEFDIKYQKYYGAGAMEGASKAYINLRKYSFPHRKEGIRFGTVSTLNFPPMGKKFLESMGVAFHLTNPKGYKFKICKLQDIIKILSYFKDEIKFRSDLVDFWILLKNLSPDFSVREQQILQFNKEVNDFILDKSLVETNKDYGAVGRKALFEKRSGCIEGALSKINKLKTNSNFYLEKIESQINKIERINKHIEAFMSDRALCRDCNLSKPKSEFYSSNVHYSGVQLYCKTCTSRKNKIKSKKPEDIERRRRYYIDNKETILQKMSENRPYRYQDDYDKYVDITVGNGDDFWENDEKDFAEYQVKVHKGVGMSKKEFDRQLEKEWKLLPNEMKDYYKLPHELTAKEIYKLRSQGLVEIDHILPKARIKKLVQQGHAKGMEVHPHHGFNLRALPTKINRHRSASLTLFEYYPNHKKHAKRIWRMVFQKS